MHPVEYRLPDALLCLDGTLPPRDFFAYPAHIPIIAADGAAIRLAERGVKPSIIIGDFDTLHRSGLLHRFEAIPQLHIAEQDSTDFEKCLDYCTNAGFGSVLVCGIHGGEMEHSLNNWSIAMRYASRLALCLYDAGRYGLPVNHSVDIPVQAGDTISLIPQPHAVLTTSGLHWPLRNEELRLGYREGARNRADSSRITIDLHEGSLLVFCNAAPPLMPVVVLPQHNR